jgi:Protein of unknown function (DUF2892)
MFAAASILRFRNWRRRISPGIVAIFHCRSGARTRSNAAHLATKVDDSCEVCLLEGGLDAWRKAGLPTVVDRRQPIELQRQVQIGAGGLTLAGTILGLLLSPWFFAVPLFIGAGLLFAGLSGFCGMAVLLQHAPWNRTAAAGDQTQKVA